MNLDFLQACANTLRWEGETYTDHPLDRGGPTKYGLTLKFLRGHRLTIHPKQLTLEKALPIYFLYVWEKHNIHKFSTRAWPVAAKYFDMVVLHGPRNATKILQRAVNKVEAGALKVDGSFGPLTIKESVRAGDFVTGWMCSEQQAFFERIVKHRPNQRVFLRGWSKRAKYNPSSLVVN